MLILQIIPQNRKERGLFVNAIHHIKEKKKLTKPDNHLIRYRKGL